MTGTTLIPLNKLIAWDGNIRKTSGVDTALAELAASIAEHGLINNLVVLPEKDGLHPVVTGGRRLAAHQLLVEHGKMAAHHPVKCKIRQDAATALEISLAENFIREDMHPADEFEAFKVLADQGIPAADIGARLRYHRSRGPVALAFAMAQRKREVGIRIASGAKPHHILAVLLTQNAKPTRTGVDFTDLE